MNNDEHLGNIIFTAYMRGQMTIVYGNYSYFNDNTVILKNDVEIDSVGGKRTSSTLHPYANQTINQLLAEIVAKLVGHGIWQNIEHAVDDCAGKCSHPYL